MSTDLIPVRHAHRGPEGRLDLTEHLTARMRLKILDAITAVLGIALGDFIEDSGPKKGPEAAPDTIMKWTGVLHAETEQQVDYCIAAPAHALAYPVGARTIEMLHRRHSRAWERGSESGNFTGSCCSADRFR